MVFLQAAIGFSLGIITLFIGALIGSFFVQGAYGFIMRQYYKRSPSTVWPFWITLIISFAVIAIILYTCRNTTFM